MRKRVAQKHQSETHHTAVSHNALVSTEEPLNTFYIDSGAGVTLFPHQATLTRSPRSPSRYQQPTVERPTLMDLGPGEWQRSRTRVRSARRILRTWSTCATCVAWETRTPRMGCPPMRRRDGAAKLGWGPVHQRREGERGAQHDPSEGRISCMRDGR